jgi:large subunit ribosomal protein L17
MPKAKHVKSFIEKLITLAKKGDLASRRRAIAILGDHDIVQEVDGEVERKGTIIGKLFSDIGPRYLDRAGGYTRIIKLAKVRLGDNSPLVLLQLVGQEKQQTESAGKGKKKAAKKKKTKAEKAAEADKELPRD